MCLTYIALLITVVVALSFRYRRIVYALMGLALGLAYYEGMVNIIGIITLGTLWVLTFIYSRPGYEGREAKIFSACVVTYLLAGLSMRAIPTLGPWVFVIISALVTIGIVCWVLLSYLDLDNRHRLIKLLSFSGIVMLLYGILLHLIPGFSNPIILNNVQFSKLSYPFTMYFNFNKVMAGLILYTTTSHYMAEKRLDLSSLKYTFITAFSCVMVVVGLAISFQFIKFDFKIPTDTLTWAVNNFFFVCFTEEVVFRGFLQNNIAHVLKRYTARSSLISLIATACIFGLLHFKGGGAFIMLSTIAGIFYGYAYYKTNRILPAMIVHFALNLAHFIFFTYPAAIR